MMRIYSIRERPEYIPAMLESLENHWPACMPWIQKHMEQVRQTDAPLPDAYIAVEKGKVVGGYTLAVKEILWSEDKGLWIATLYVDPAFRGRHLSPVLLAHARRPPYETRRPPGCFAVPSGRRRSFGCRSRPRGPPEPRCPGRRPRSG